MDVWAHRESFKKAVAEYRTAKGIRLAEVAVLLGLRESTLKDYLYRQDVKPSLEVLQAAASAFGCSVTEFIDDPGAELPGVPKDGLDRLSEAKRAVMHMMFQNLRHEDITDEQALQYLDVIESLVKAGKIRKPRYE